LNYILDIFDTEKNLWISWRNISCEGQWLYL